MKPLCVLVTCLCLAGVPLAAPAAHAESPANTGDQAVRYDGDKVVRVTLRTPADAKFMADLHSDPWTCGYSADEPIQSPRQVDFLVTLDAFTKLSQSGIPSTVLIDNVQTLIDAEQARLAFSARGVDFFADFRSYDDVNTYLDALIALRPDIASSVTIGSSVQGRSIRGVKLAVAPTNPASPKPTLVINSCQHAREWITVSSTMWVADRLIRQYGTDPAATRLLDAFDVVILPIINPDGYAYTWSPTGDRLRRTNIDGVDLNRNWDINFAGVGSSTYPGVETYCGPSAFSEPETFAYKSYLASVPTLALVLDIHSYDEFILEPWAYTPEVALDQATLHSLSSAIRQGMYTPYHTPYINGPCYTTLYPASGTCPDWIYATRRIYAMCIELPPEQSAPNGFIVPPSAIAPAGTELFDGVSSAADWFAQHTITVSFPDGAPTYFYANNTLTFRVRFTRGTQSPMPGVTPTISWRVGRFGPFTTTPLTVESTDSQGTIYNYTLHTGVCRSVMQWYYTLHLADGTLWSEPIDDHQPPFEVPVISAGCNGTPCAGDFSRDGVKDVNDIFDFLREWFAHNADADFDANGTANVTDIFAFLRAWFASCP